MSKIYEGIFSPRAVWHGHFTEKERNRWRNFFPALINAIWSILLKYQKLDVQIQAFTDEN